MALTPRSLAGQAFALQAAVIVIVVLAGSALALLDARNDADDAAMLRCRALLDAAGIAVGFEPEPRITG
mgnify:CR=1 FL=1